MSNSYVGYEILSVLDIVKNIIFSAASNDIRLECDHMECYCGGTFRKNSVKVSTYDVWNTNVEEWDALIKKLLASCGDESSILVTTRDIKVIASIVGTTEAFHLKSLGHKYLGSLVEKHLAQVDWGLLCLLILVRKLFLNFLGFY